MIREYICHDDYDRKIVLDKTATVRYYSQKQMKAIYPDHGYVVLGAVGKGVRHPKDEVMIDGEAYPFYTLEYRKIAYGIDGYIDCGNHEYIAVVRSRLIRNVLMLLVLLAVICGLIFGGLMLLGDRIGLDPNIGDYEPKITLPDNADPNSIAIPGYDEMRMKADTDEIYVALWNPKTNPCYFKFTIAVEESGKVLYQSGLVPPGKAITRVKISQKLKEGTYPVLIRMETFSLEDGKTPMNSGTSKTVIKAVSQ